MEMRFDALYCFFVFINGFNTFGQEYVQKMLFYFLLVIPTVTIALFSLASSEVVHGVII